MSVGSALRLFIRAAKYRWRLDAPEIARMLGRISRGGRVIDVGAHKGAYTFWMARKAGARGEVLAVEPQANLCSDLRESLGSFGLKQVCVLETALSSHSGTSLLHVPTLTSTQSATLTSPADAAGFRNVEVKTSTIDELVESRSWKSLDFIKVDAEGHELDIIRGAHRTLGRFKPAVLVEAEARKHVGDESHLAILIRELGSHGYRGTFYDGSTWRAIDELDIDRHQRFGHGRFCNNFFFEVK